MNKPEKELDERDWFAAHAPFDEIAKFSNPMFTMDHLADHAYQYADAMMKRRLQPPASKAVDVINSIIDSAPKHATPSRQGSRNTFA